MKAERAALRVSQRELVARCRKTESCAVLCGAGIWLLAAAVGLWFATSPCLSAASGVLGIALWFGGIASYRVACEDRPGWVSALAWYHLANGIWMVTLALVGWVVYTTFDLFPEKVWTVYLPLAVLLLSITAHVVLNRVKPTWQFWIFGGPYRIAGQKVAKLQRLNMFTSQSEATPSERGPTFDTGRD
jgi:hypothetical protein